MPTTPERRSLAKSWSWDVSLRSVLLAFSLSSSRLTPHSRPDGFPDIVAKPVGKIPARQIRQLVQMGVVRPDEKVLFFYSSATFSIRGDGNLFTDQRVISYQQSDGQLESYDAKYEDIASIKFEPGGSNWLDSTIVITLDDGSWFVLYVSTEANGDKLFYEKLTELWNRRTAKQPSETDTADGE